MNIVKELNPGGLADLSFPIAELDGNLPEAVIQATAEFNLASRTGTERYFIASLYDKVRPKRGTGMQWALLNEPGDSTNTAVLHFNPNAHAFDDNVGARMLLRAEFIRRVLRYSGVTDPEGKFLPVLAFASPSGKCFLPLTQEERDWVRGGYFGEVAAKYLTIARRQGFGRVALVGQSQGGTLAVAGAP